MNDDICRAIRERCIVRFQYDGGIRHIEPYCHGFSRDDNELVRAYQIGGFSSSGETVGWKTYRIDRCSAVVVTGIVFTGPREGYDRADNRMATIHCCL